MGCVQRDTRSLDYSSLANPHACTLQNFPVSHLRGLRNLKGFFFHFGRTTGPSFREIAFRRGGFPKLGGTIMGVPIRRITVLWGLVLGPPMLGNYDILTCATQDRQNSRVRSQRLRGLWAQCVRAARFQS